MRKIEKAMLNWIDTKLANNGLAQKAIADKDPRTLFRLAAESCVGIKETSHNSGPMVELIQSTVGDAVKEPWCASFVMTCLNYAEVRTGIKSPIVASEHCQTIWQESPRNLRVKNIPASGALIIWRKGATSSGHIGIVLEYMNKTMRTCEGNTSDSNMSDGDCVAVKIRNVKQTGNLRVLGFLRPF